LFSGAMLCDERFAVKAWGFDFCFVHTVVRVDKEKMGEGFVVVDKSAVSDVDAE